MKRLALLGAVVVGCVAIAGSAVFADAAANPNTIKIGLTRPQDGFARDTFSNVWLNVGYERVLRQMPDGTSDITAEVSWFQDSVTAGGAKYTVRTIPILVNWRKHAANRGEASTSFYYGAGAGFYLGRAHRGGSNPASNSETRLGIAPFVGVEGQNWQAELKYHITGDLAELNMGGLAATVGYRF